jgi:pimeloyl-ACP methyl ester carboxylesterase
MNTSPKAALLLIPGMLNQPAIWDAVIAQVRAQLGGQLHIGVADVLTQASIPDMARDAWTCLDAIPAHTPCYLAGFSMGGYVALEMLAHPQRAIQEAWLLSTSAQPESPESAPLREKSIAGFAQDFEKTIQATARWGTFEKTPAQTAPLVQAMRALGAPTAIRQTRAIMQRRDLRARLAALDLPVHVLCGMDDRITPRQLSQDLAALIPKAQLQLIEQSGHMLPFEQPELIAQSICQRIAAEQEKTHAA